MISTNFLLNIQLLHNANNLFVIQRTILGICTNIDWLNDL